jgi:polar amino acid transport system permease protein
MKRAVAARQSIRSSFFKLRRSAVLRSPWMDVLQFVALVALLIWFMSWSTARLGYVWHWYRVPRFLYTWTEGRLVAGPLLQGLLLTLKISGLALVLSMALGLTTALLRLSDSVTGRILSRGYLELIRNTPLLVQLFVVYFILGPILGMGNFVAAILALTLFEGAYSSEIFRAGIVSIHKGQWEAAHSLGLSLPDTYRHVILPQAVRRILPPLASQMITLVKDSALVSMIALADLTQQARIIIAQTFMSFEIWFATAGMYLVVTVSLSLIVRYIEKRFRIYT